MAAGEYLVCFSQKCEKEEVKQYFVDCLSRAKFSVTREEFEGKTLLTVDAPFEILANKVSFHPRCGDELNAYHTLNWNFKIIFSSFSSCKSEYDLNLSLKIFCCINELFSFRRKMLA